MRQDIALKEMLSTSGKSSRARSLSQLALSRSLTSSRSELLLECRSNLSTFQEPLNANLSSFLPRGGSMPDGLNNLIPNHREKSSPKIDPEKRHSQSMSEIIECSNSLAEESSEISSVLNMDLSKSEENLFLDDIELEEQPVNGNHDIGDELESTLEFTPIDIEEPVHENEIFEALLEEPTPQPLDIESDPLSSDDNDQPETIVNYIEDNISNTTDSDSQSKPINIDVVNDNHNNYSDNMNTNSALANHDKCVDKDLTKVLHSPNNNSEIMTGTGRINASKTRTCYARYFCW